MSLDKQIEHIRKTHASAQPRRENISWWNTHNDLTVALNRIAELEAQLEAVRKDGERKGRLLRECRGHLKGWKMSMLASTPERLLAKIDAALEATLTKHNNSRTGVAE